MTGIFITHAVTDDLPNGTPWLPDGDANIFWSMVTRASGRTVWRRIALKEEEPSSPKGGMSERNARA